MFGAWGHRKLVQRPEVAQEAWAAVGTSFIPSLIHWSSQPARVGSGLLCQALLPQGLQVWGLPWGQPPWEKEVALPPVPRNILLDMLEGIRVLLLW